MTILLTIVNLIFRLKVKFKNNLYLYTSYSNKDRLQNWMEIHCIFDFMTLVRKLSVNYLNGRITAGKKYLVIKRSEFHSFTVNGVDQIIYIGQMKAMYENKQSLSSHYSKRLLTIEILSY